MSSRNLFIIYLYFISPALQIRDSSLLIPLSLFLEEWLFSLSRTVRILNKHAAFPVFSQCFQRFRNSVCAVKRFSSISRIGFPVVPCFIGSLSAGHGAFSPYILPAPWRSSRPLRSTLQSRTGLPQASAGHPGR